MIVIFVPACANLLLPVTEQVAAALPCVHCVRDGVPVLWWCGDFVCMFALQKADGSSVRVCCLRENMDLHWANCSSFICCENWKDQIPKDAFANFFM